MTLTRQDVWDKLIETHKERKHAKNKLCTSEDIADIWSSYTCSATISPVEVDLIKFRQIVHQLRKKHSVKKERQDGHTDWWWQRSILADKTCPDDYEMEIDVSVSQYRSKIKAFSCKLCEKSYKCRYELTTHLRSHTGERPAVCHYCNKGFIDNKSLNRHLKIHTKENLFECEYCRKKFNDRSGLIVHRRLHTGEKPYKCDVCHKAFTQPGAVKAHKKIHRDDGQFRCMFCASSFDLKGRLKSHITHFHKDLKKTKVEQKEPQEKVAKKSLSIIGMFVDCDADDSEISDDDADNFSDDEFNFQNGWTISSHIKKEEKVLEDKDQLIYHDDLSDPPDDHTSEFIDIKQESLLET